MVEVGQVEMLCSGPAAEGGQGPWTRLSRLCPPPLFPFLSPPPPAPCPEPALIIEWGEVESCRPGFLSHTMWGDA